MLFRSKSKVCKKHYMKSLGYFQNQEYDNAIKGFAELVSSDATNDLADNCQYWLAECYYSKKDFKNFATSAIACLQIDLEWEKVEEANTELIFFKKPRDFKP